MKLPQVMGMVFCQNFDPRSFSLQGLFQRRDSATFPTPPHQFTIYAALYATEIEGKIELNGQQMRTEREVYRHRQWVHFPRGEVLQLIIPVRMLVFPAPGRYTFRLLFDGHELTQRHLNVCRVEEES